DGMEVAVEVPFADDGRGGRPSLDHRAAGGDVDADAEGLVDVEDAGAAEVAGEESLVEGETDGGTGEGAGDGLGVELGGDGLRRVALRGVEDALLAGDEGVQGIAERAVGGDKEDAEEADAVDDGVERELVTGRVVDGGGAGADEVGRVGGRGGDFGAGEIDG